MKWTRAVEHFKLEEDKQITWQFLSELKTKFTNKKQLPCFKKLTEYINLFGDEGGFDTMIEAMACIPSLGGEFLMTLVRSFNAVDGLLIPALRSKVSGDCSKAITGSLESQL